MKKEYLIPLALSLTASLIVGYYFYKKYKPTIDAANVVNSNLGMLESIGTSIEDAIHKIFNSMPNGNGYSATTISSE